MTLYTLRVYPLGMGREVYRVMEITGDHTLDELCEEILYAFDFDFDHMYEFCMDNRLYKQYNYVSHAEPGEPSTDIPLDEIGLYPKKKFTFHYDFGDDWQFPITVTRVEETDDVHTCRVTKSKGDIQQYPDWDDGEEDGEDEDEEDED